MFFNDLWVSRLPKAAGAAVAVERRNEKLHHFLKLGCAKIARGCREKHICKSKCKKTEGLGPFFEVRMWKNCTPLWPEGHSQFKVYKTPSFWNTFGGSDVEKVSDRRDR